MPHGSTIGLSIFPPKTGFSFWSNGAHQNVAYLWMLLRAAGYRVVMLNGGDGEPPDPATLPPPLREIEFIKISDEVVDSLDMLIEGGAQVSAEHVERVHARGGKAVTLKFGNALAIDGERAIHAMPSGAIFNGARFDEVWTTSQHEPTCGAYWEILYRCPVRVLPHIWDPCFVDAMVADFPATVRAGYQPGRAKKRIAILEPNIQLVKTCHVPMLIAEQAWRMRPELIDQVIVTNAIDMRSRPAFKTFAAALDIAHSKAIDGFPVCTFEPRRNTPYTLAAYADVVVSHGWIDTPTYLHYDVLYLGYPLVHNIAGMPGYYYPGFDARIGGAQLVRAMTEHDANADVYRAGVRAFLAERFATAPRNVEAHACALEEAIGR